MAKSDKKPTSTKDKPISSGARIKNLKRPTTIQLHEAYLEYIKHFYGKNFRKFRDMTVAYYVTNVALKDHFKKNKDFQEFKKRLELNV